MEDLTGRFSAKALEDFNLVDAAVSGDQKAFAELLQRYRRPVYFTILKMIRNTDDAEDLTIEAFGKAFKNIHKFKKDFTFSTWLFRIATNNTIDFIRKRKLHTLSLDTTFKNDDGKPVSMLIPDTNLNPQDEAIKAQKEELIHQIVDSLPARYKKLVRLRYFNELSYEEIAAEINVPLGTVKAQLHRARELMFELVKDKEHLL
jgi:RNA polymerase sigma factor (sigma-70 family)